MGDVHGSVTRAARDRGETTRKPSVRALLIAVGALIALVLPASAGAAVWTDQHDYAPGSTVTINGDNSDGAGYQVGETVGVSVSGPNEWASSCSGTADESGAWSCQITLLPDASAIGEYTYTATGETSGVSQTGAFSDGGCPAGDLSGRKEDPNVVASYTTSGDTATYALTSPKDSPVGGVPGLIAYCVFTPTLPASQTALYSNLDGAWSAEGESNHGYFDFQRSDGNPDNVPFDGSTQTIGEATWSGSVPTEQTILLHINNMAACNALYGGNEETCFVIPGKATAKAKPLTATVTADPTLKRTYKWGISKSVESSRVANASGSATFHYTVSVTHDGGTDSEWTVTGKVAVTNPNSDEVTGVEVTDSINDKHASCSVTGGTGASIAGSTTVDFPYTCTYSAKPESSTETDTAKVTWPSQTLADKSTLAAGLLEPTAPVEWTTATPTVIDGSVSVSDTLGGSLGTVTASDASPTTFSYPYTFTGDQSGTCTTHENTATFVTNTTASKGSASQTVEHCVGADLTVSKTATPAFTRTYKWSIAKSVNKTQVYVTAGTPATFTYKVVVSHDGGTDSAWKVTGTITVANPNDWEAVSLSGVTDQISNGGTCSITSGNPTGSVPAGGSVELGYECTYSSAPAPASYTNTATATWNATSAATPDGEAAGKVSGAFGAPTSVVDDSVRVSDSLAGPLGTLSASGASPQTFSYSHTFSGDPEGKCTTHENTATFLTNTTATKGSASQSVEVCVLTKHEREKGGVNATCNSITFFFRNFPNLPNNTVTEKVAVHGTIVDVLTFVFNGPTGSNTIPITVPQGVGKVDGFATWNTNGVKGSWDVQWALTCDPPSITAVAPASGTKAGGTPVTVKGTAFAPGATAFSFGGKPATSVSCTSTTECTMVTPAHPKATVVVKATVNGASSATQPGDEYTYF